VSFESAEHELERKIRAKLDALNPNERRLAEIRLGRIVKRKQAIRRFRSPGHIAKFTNPEVIQTDMMVELDKAVIQAETGLQRQWLISTPPQEGKTLRLGTAAPLSRAWPRDPAWPSGSSSSPTAVATRATGPPPTRRTTSA
jgi:hypothetical protein